MEKNARLSMIVISHNGARAHSARNDRSGRKTAQDFAEYTSAVGSLESRAENLMRHE
jgi:hypothetical protein